MIAMQNFLDPSFRESVSIAALIAASLEDRDSGFFFPMKSPGLIRNM